MALIQLEKVSKTYESKGASIPALKDVSFEVEEGEFLSIVGPSGCGKSTLLKIVSGLLPATEGKVSVQGKEVKEPMSDVGMVFQTPVLLPWRNVLSNVLLPIEVLRLDMKEYDERARKLLEFMGLEGFLDRKAYELSGGMQQRVSLARALITEPKILLMDEPFGALDAQTRERMGNELQRIWQATKSTVLFVTHDISEGVFLGDKVLVISERPGRILLTLKVDIERPRPPNIRDTSKFTEHTREVRGYLGLV